MTNERSDNPYVGPLTFTEAQRHLFFGREREASDLFARVLSERLVLFYAQSGAGKSSLINASLIPQLRDFGYAVLPVARVSGELPKGVSAVENIYLFNLMLSLDYSGHQPSRFAHMPLSHFLAHLSSDDGKQYLYEEAVDLQPTPLAPSAIPCLLIIDQFEELITTNLDHWKERADFFVQLSKAMVGDPNLWVLLAFREDYIAPIEQYAPLMMDRMRARFYMERMGIEAARKAVSKPAAYGGRPFEPDALKQLVDNLSQIRIAGQEATIAGQYVEPVQLQVVCYQLWENVKNQPPRSITKEDLIKAGDVAGGLGKFYAEVLQEALALSFPGVSEARLRDWVEKALITEGNTRSMAYQGEVDTAGMPNTVVQFLSSRFLLRVEPRAGANWVELIHDNFVEPIRRANAEWRLNQNTPKQLLRTRNELIGRGFVESKNFLDTVYQRHMKIYTVLHYLALSSHGLLLLAGISLLLGGVWYIFVRGVYLAGIWCTGLGVVAFIAYYLRRPLAALEESLQIITWIGIAYNSYWTRLAYVADRETVQVDLEDATTDAIRQLQAIFDRRGSRAALRPELPGNNDPEQEAGKS